MTIYDSLEFYALLSSEVNYQQGKTSEMETYELNISTNKRFSGAGTDSTVQVMITGQSQNSTKWTTLDHIFLNDFEAASTQKYTVSHSGTIGIPVMLSFRLQTSNTKTRSLLEQDETWMCNKVDIKYKETNYPCPIYDWVTTKPVSFVVGKATLPQQTSLKCLKEMRMKEIKENQENFPWSPKSMESSELGWKINRFLMVNENKPLPMIFQTTLDQLNRSAKSGFGGAVDAGMELFQGDGTPQLPGKFQALDEYKVLYQRFKTPHPYFINDWMKDTEMGRQVLTGIAPISVERCTSLPANCNVTAEDVDQSLPAGKTLHDEIEAGRIYIADYSFVSPIQRNVIPLTNKHYFAADCIGLFYAAENGDFLPIAIQLVPNDKASVFTPSDAEYDWLLAKMYFRATHSCLHAWIYHFFLTHGVSEVFSVATFRNFPQCHPLYKLLRPHLRGVCKINTDARQILVPTTSLANQSISLNAIDTLRHHYKTFDISELDIPAQLKAKGLDDKELLPNYPYRDDALDVWSAIETYVTNVIKFYYKNDSDVSDDNELQAWAYDIAHESLGWQDGNTRGMPDKMTSVDQLIRICTIVIFSSSAQHAAVNFGQMETCQFVPNAPACMMLPVHKKGEGKLERIMASLPPVPQSTIFLTFVYALSMYSQDEIFLGDVIEKLFTEPEVIHMQLEFKQELVKLETKFAERNKSLKHPYTYLHPEKIPIDINI